MARRRLSSEQKQELLIEGVANPGKVSALCRKYGVSRSSYYRWKQEFNFFFGREGVRDSADMFILTNCFGLPERAERSLRQVLYRLPPRAANSILDPYVLVIYTDAISTRAYRMFCHPHPEAVNYWLQIVTLTPEIETMSDEALMGVIAHELAHVFLEHAAPPLRCQDKEEFERESARREEEADNLAKKWGFAKMNPTLGNSSSRCHSTLATTRRGWSQL